MPLRVFLYSMDISLTKGKARRQSTTFAKVCKMQAWSAQSGGSPLERDWQPKLVGFTWIEVMPVQSIALYYFYVQARNQFGFLRKASSI